ncbi:MAG: hypothetical protein KGQ51_17840, partial [Planctomycetes bacterium]|nr:hypothetical protein [Planctomycetota bacterium]
MLNDYDFGSLSFLRCVRWITPTILQLLTVILSLFFIENPVLAEAGNEVATSPVSQTNMLVWLIRVSGIIGAFILLLSIYFVALAVKSFLELNMKTAVPPDTLAAAESFIQERNIKETVKLLEQDDSF